MQCHIISLTNCMNEQLLTLFKALRKNSNLIGKEERVSQGTAIEHKDLPFQGCKGKQKKNLDHLGSPSRMVRTRCQWQDTLNYSHHLSLCAVVESIHLLWIFPGHQLELLMASVGRFNCTKEKSALECAVGTSIPSKAPNMLESAQSTMTPLCFPHLE